MKPVRKRCPAPRGRRGTALPSPWGNVIRERPRDSSGSMKRDTRRQGSDPGSLWRLHLHPARRQMVGSLPWRPQTACAVAPLVMAGPASLVSVPGDGDGGVVDARNNGEVERQTTSETDKHDHG